MELEWLVSWHVHEGNKSKDFKAIFFWLLLFQYSIHSVYFLNECYTNFKFHGIHLLHRINPYCTVFGSHLLHRMHPYYTVIGSHLLHIINPWLHWFWFNFTLYYLYLASDYTISDYTVFQKYSIQCIPGSCCTPTSKSNLTTKTVNNMISQAWTSNLRKIYLINPGTPPSKSKITTKTVKNMISHA